MKIKLLILGILCLAVGASKSKERARAGQRLKKHRAGMQDLMLNTPAVMLGLG